MSGNAESFEDSATDARGQEFDLRSDSHNYGSYSFERQGPYPPATVHFRVDGFLGAGRVRCEIRLRRFDAR